MLRHNILIRSLQFGICMVLLLFAYSNFNWPISSWRNEALVVVVSQNTSLPDMEFSKQLAQRFADKLHVPIKFVEVPADQVAVTLRNHRAHFSATGFRMDQKNDSLLLGPSYLAVHEQVAFNQDTPPPHQLIDLVGKRIAVIAGSNHENTLIALKADLPGLKWESRSKQTEEDLLREIAQGSLDYTITNHEQIEQMNNFYLNLAAAFDVGKPSKLAWAFPADADNDLITAAEQFFAEIKKNGELNELLDRYYGHNDRLAPMDAATFVKETGTTLPKFRSLFEEAGRSINADWRLIAAIAYQESHWDPLATSTTNVRGMMMLTEATADRMEVSNRLDARESILAGAKYLDLIKKQLPSRIGEPARTWLALSAYNQGQGHLEDARVLTQRKGNNPDSWTDVKKWMPLLKDPEYFQDLKYGYARGGEAVIFVENIRSYYDMLTRISVEKIGTHDYQLGGAEPKSDFPLNAQTRVKKPTQWPTSIYSLSR